MKPIILIFAGAALMVASQSSTAQLFNDFEPAAVDSSYGFRVPRFSGSTAGNLATEPNVFRVVAGFGDNLTQAGQFDFGFLDNASTRWARLTTFNALGVPNPVVALSQIVQFDIYSVNDIRLALGIREDSDVAGPVGANGGSTGGIEWVGAERATASAGTPPGGLLITGGAWHTVSFNLMSDPTFAFTGNGVLSGDWGTMESLAVSSMGSAAQTIYLDNFRVIPEPGTLALVTLGGAGLLARRMCRRK